MITLRTKLKSMTQVEILTLLINKGIIHKIGESFLITDKYERLIGSSDSGSTIELPTVSLELSVFYPSSIRDVKPSERVEAILDYCKVPETVNISGREYFVRSYDKNTRKVINSIIENSAYKPQIVLTAIEAYYTHTEYPKSFKNFVADNDIFSVYKMYDRGDSLGGTEIPDAASWL